MSHSWVTALLKVGLLKKSWSIPLFVSIIHLRSRNLWRERTNFVVDATLQVAHVNPTLLLLHLRVIVQNFVSQPRQVIHSQLVLFTCRRRMMIKRKHRESYNQSLESQITHSNYKTSNYASVVCPFSEMSHTVALYIKDASKKWQQLQTVQRIKPSAYHPNLHHYIYMTENGSKTSISVQ